MLHIWDKFALLLVIIYHHILPDWHFCNANKVHILVGALSKYSSTKHINISAKFSSALFPGHLQHKINEYILHSSTTLNFPLPNLIGQYTEACPRFFSSGADSISSQGGGEAEIVFSGEESRSKGGKFVLPLPIKIISALRT